MGSVIKTGEGDDPIGLLTVLSTQSSGAADKALQEFRAFLLRSIRDAADQEKLREVSSHSLSPQPWPLLQPQPEIHLN